MKLKVISLNLWDGGNLFPNVLAFFKQHEDADIVLLQEVYNSHDPGFVDCFRSMDVLKEKMPYPYHAFAPCRLDKLLVGKIEAGNAVLSKFPIKSSEVHFFNEPYGERDAYDQAANPSAPTILQHAVTDADGTGLNIFNIHGVWDLDGDNYSERRKRMSEVTIEHVSGKQNVILAGDTNAKPTNQAMRNIAEQLPSVFGTELKTTYNMRRKSNPGYATAACDQMYASPNIRVLSKDCPDVDISDHLPLVVTFEIPEDKSKKEAA